MALAMTKDEREAFLAGVHVGVLSVTAPGRGPLSAPVWYGYEPGGDVIILTGTNAPKTAMLREQGRATLVAQSEQAPYVYVTVEGPVTLEPVAGDDSLTMAVRYLGPEMGKRYAEGGSEGSVKVRLTPLRWRSEDYRKLGL
ncbi:MAG: pyridoxamine 5'-phosphate oxidase family protein [Anaerolineaceae bacterium]